MVKRVYIIAGVIFILVFMVWGLGRICYNVDLDSLLKKTENSSLDTSQEKNQYLNYQIINGNLYLQKEDGLYQYNYETFLFFSVIFYCFVMIFYYFYLISLFYPY